MTLLCGENGSRRISEGRPGERQGNKGKQGEKGRKERIRQQKEEAACRGNGRRRTDKKKVLKRFCLRTSVKTATTYSPTCAVPSA